MERKLEEYEAVDGHEHQEVDVENQEEVKENTQLAHMAPLHVRAPKDKLSGKARDDVHGEGGEAEDDVIDDQVEQHNVQWFLVELLVEDGHNDENVARYAQYHV